MFPEVGSTIVPPGLSTPFLSASSTTASAILSLTLRPGLDASSFAQTVAAIPVVMWLRRTSGVLPTASSTLAEIFVISILLEYQQGRLQLTWQKIPCKLLKTKNQSQRPGSSASCAWPIAC